MTFVNTRPQPYAESLTRLLRSAGHESFELSLSELKSTLTEAVLARFRETYRTGDWLVFTSRTGVDVLANELGPEGSGRIFSSASIAVIGEGTGEAVQEKGGRVALAGRSADSQSFAVWLLERLAPHGHPEVRYFHAAAASPEFATALRSAGLHLTEIPTYEAVDLVPPPEVASGLRDLLHSNALQGILFGSAGGVRRTRQFASEILNAPLLERFLRLPAGTIGEPTRRAAEAAGWSVQWVPERPLFSALVERITGN